MFTVLLVMALLIAVSVGLTFVTGIPRGLGDRLSANYLGKVTAEASELRRGLRLRWMALRGSDLPALVAAAQSSRAAVADRLDGDHDQPTELIAAVHRRLTDPASELHRRRVLLLGVGPRSYADCDAAVAEISDPGIVDVVVLGSHAMAAAQRRARTTTSMDDAVRWANESVSDGRADAVVVVIRPPVFEGDRAQVGNLVDGLAQIVCPLEVVIEASSDPNAWPEHVRLVLPLPKFAVSRSLRKMATDKPSLNCTRGEARLSRTDAADAIESLLGRSFRVARKLSGEKLDDAPWWEARLSLSGADSKSPPLLPTSQDDLSRSAYDARLNALGVTVRSPAGETGRRLPLYPVPAFMVLSRGALSEAQASGPPRREDASPVIGPGALGQRLELLKQASARGDGKAVETLLTDEGRAWIESGDLAVRGALEEVRAESITPLAKLTAHFLSALDEALRVNNPDIAAFDARNVQEAEVQSQPLGLLFRAERAEFARLRNELDLSMLLLNEVIERIPTVEASDLLSWDRYAYATTHFVVSNSLRRGGQYRAARKYLLTAMDVFDSSIPSHQAELMHCRYAEGVCLAMQGSPVVLPTEFGRAWKSEFGSALVVLANSHAAWFIEDYERAAAFASSASHQFRSIGYTRYARRADRLEKLLTDWQVLSTGGSVDDVLSPEVRALLTAPAESDVVLLASERPSRALSLLQFARRFMPEFEAPRQTVLPRRAIRNQDNRWSYSRHRRSSSLAVAEAELRRGLRVPTDAKFPLAAD